MGMFGFIKKNKERFLDYSEVDKIFKYMTINKKGNDIYWYHKVWEILKQQHLTSFTDEKSHICIYARIFTIVSMFTEFCEKLFSTQIFIDEQLSHIVKIVALECPSLNSQPYGTSEDFLLAYSCDERKTIVDALKIELYNFDIFNYMYCASGVLDETFLSYEDYLSFAKQNEEPLMDNK